MNYIITWVKGSGFKVQSSACDELPATGSRLELVKSNRVGFKVAQCQSPGLEGLMKNPVTNSIRNFV
jgi:hypothetical protein